jgi:hypothetical protein
VKYTTKQIEEAAKKLRKLPAVQDKEHTSKQAVKLLQDELAALLARGYSLEKVGRALRSAGNEISALTLREYLRTSSTPSKPAPRASAPKRKAAKRKERVSKPPSTPAKARPAARKVPPPPPPPKAAKAKPTTPNLPAPPNPIFQRGNLTLAKATFQVRPDTPDSDL